MPGESRDEDDRCPAVRSGWAAAWNERDLESVLGLFHDDAVFTSPLAIRIGFNQDGIMRGKEEMRRYWTEALALSPGLHLEISALYEGIDTLVIAFRNQKGEDRAELLRFRNGLVVEGHGASSL